MQKTSPIIITIRYILVAGLLFAIWTGCAWAIKLTCTLCIMHSEILYVINRLQEAKIAKIMDMKMSSMPAMKDSDNGTKNKNA